MHCIPTIILRYVRSCAIIAKKAVMGEKVFRTGLATHLQEVCEGTLKASTQVEYVLLGRRGARDLAKLLFQSSTLLL